MNRNYEFQIARANEAASEAKLAVLDNVRQRALRSEAAWRDMAARTRLVDDDRAKATLERERTAALLADETPPLAVAVAD